jgi:hypothetical protein
MRPLFVFLRQKKGPAFGAFDLARERSVEEQIASNHLP